MRQWIARNLFRNAALVLLALLVALVSDARAVTINWTPVGNPGNGSDTIVMNDHTSGYGAVAYSYNIGTYDVTNSQYVEFLNAKDPAGTNSLLLYNINMNNVAVGGINFNSGSANGSNYSLISSHSNWPVNYVTWFDAIRFANWVNNGGMVTSDTESGAYKLDGGTPVPSNANSIARQLGANVFLPSENEWYKAAYYNPATSSYFQYPTSSSTVPTASVPTGAINSANFNNTVSHPTNVGAYAGTTSPYGALDTGGNVQQWNEASISGSNRGLRGGDYEFGSFLMESAFRNADSPQGWGPNIGFRLAMIPEPNSLILAVLGFAGLTAWGWRRRKLSTFK